MNTHVTKTAPTWPMSSEKVKFTNGMIVTADDLKAAMMYPVSLMQITNRAVYGCGVICGFDLKPHPGLCDTPDTIEVCNPDDPSQPDTKTVFPSHQIEVGPGTAMDCHGLPIELCKPLLVDLSPEASGCDPKSGGTVCILIRRIEASDGPRGDCCAGGTPECSRLRDHVEIKGFTKDAKDFPDHVCAHSVSADPDPCAPDSGTKQDSPETTCDCLKKCDDCTCCGEGWVLLGCLQIDSHGLPVWEVDRENETYKKMLERRKYIKPIECACLPHSHPHTHDKSGQSQDAANATAARFKSQTNTAQKRMYEVIEKTVTIGVHRDFIIASQPKDLDEVLTTLDAVEKAPKAAQAIFRSDFIKKAPGYRDEIKRQLEAKAKPADKT